MPNYQIDIYAGSPDANGSARRGADVRLTLYGTKASSGELVLGDGDTFQRRLADLGDLKRLHVRHDDVGLGPRWFLERITVRNLETQEEWTFPCNRWLARNEDDGEIERTLDAA
ncbi:MAG TPA: PLAT/LH2 domain-containing protein [Acidimicrobiales bacterium]